MPTSDDGRGERESRTKRVSGKALAWIVLIGIAILVGVPIALLEGLGDAVFDSPKQGIITFFGTVALAAIFFLGSLGWDLVKDRWRERHKK